MIERFLLPDDFMCAQLAIDGMRRRSLDGLHDLGKGKDSSAHFICEWRENQVDVIGHDHNDAQVVSLAVIMPAAIEHDLPRPICQGSPILRYECDEVRLVVALQMRQIAAIKC